MISLEFLLSLFFIILIAVLLSIVIKTNFLYVYQRDYSSIEEYINQSLIYEVRMD